MWVIRSDLIPDFLELVCELTSHSGSPEPDVRTARFRGPVASVVMELLAHLLPMTPPDSTRFTR